MQSFTRSAVHMKLPSPGCSEDQRVQVCVTAVHCMQSVSGGL